MIYEVNKKMHVQNLVKASAVRWIWKDKKYRRRMGMEE